MFNTIILRCKYTNTIIFNIKVKTILKNIKRKKAKIIRKIV